MTSSSSCSMCGEEVKNDGKTLQRKMWEHQCCIQEEDRLTEDLFHSTCSSKSMLCAELVGIKTLLLFKLECVG